MGSTLMAQAPRGTVTGEPVAVVEAPLRNAAVAPRQASGAMLPAMTFTEMLSMGDHLVRTGFLPKHVRNGAQAAAIMLAGRELGMTPMRSFRSLQMVEGKITESADSQLGRFKVAGGRARFNVLTEEQAELWLRHPNGDEHVERFTMEDADRAYLTRPSQNGAPSNYKKHPKAMLRSRCITAGLKSLGWDGAVDVYDPEELDGVLEGTPQFGAESAGEEMGHPSQPVAGSMSGPIATQAAGSAVDPEAEPATEKQRALLDRLLQSHLFSDKERDAAKQILTKKRMSKAIEYAQQQIAERRKAEEESKVRAQDAANAAIAEHHASLAGSMIDEFDDEARIERDALRSGS
jgi:hypothetical protein